MFTYTYTLAARAKAELMLLKGDRKGVTALEYGLLAGLIAVVIIGSVTALGLSVSGLFTAISTAMPAA
jgi:pilus assembly protein Flp/PilA